MSEVLMTSINGVIRQMTEEEQEAHLATAQNQPKTAVALVSMRQFRLAIINAKKVTAVSDAIKGIANTTERAKVQVEWDYNPVVERNAPWVLAIMEGVGFSEDEVDALFLDAATL